MQLVGGIVEPSGTEAIRVANAVAAVNLIDAEPCRRRQVGQDEEASTATDVQHHGTRGEGLHLGDRPRKQSLYIER